MQAFLTTLLECSVAMSAISLAYMAAMPLLSKRYTPKWRYYVWLVIVIGWILPFRPQLDATLLPVQISAIQVIPVEYIGAGEPLMMVANETSRVSSILLWWVIAGIWVIGVMGMITYHAWRHWRFIKMVSRWSEDVTNSQALGILDALRAELKIRTQVELKACPGITSPMMIGFLRPVVLLPSTKIAADGLALILRHELVHFKRNDLWYKALVLLATAVHWFNPVVYIMAKAIAAQCEISCDELVLQGASFQQRKQYGETIIGVVRNGAKLQTVLSTNFYGGKKSMKTRIFSIMDTTKKKAGIAILGVALIATIGTGIVFAANSPNDVTVEEKGKNRVTERVADGDKILFDFETIEAGDNIRVGGYTLHKGDTVQLDYTYNGSDFTVLILESSNASPIDGELIKNKSSYTIPKDGSYYFLLQNSAQNDKPSENVEIAIEFHTNGEPEELITKATHNMGTYSEFLTKVENDQVQYYYNGCWVRSLYDENNQNAKPILYFNAVEDQDVLGKGTPIYLKTIRNKETNEIEKLVEMSEDEVFQLLGNDNIIHMAIIPPRLSLSEENVATDEPAEQEFIGPTESKQFINVDVKFLDSGEFVCLGQYTLKEGDIINYNITAEGNGNLNVEFRKTADPRDNKGYLGHSGFVGNSINFSSFKVKDLLAGTYYLWVGNYDGETLNNIKGTVEIAVEKATE